MSRFEMMYDREGNPIDSKKWAELNRSGHDYSRIGLVRIPGFAMISTVWLGLNHNFYSGDPLIFETLIETIDSTEIIHRYSTEEAAIKGHQNSIKWFIKHKHHLIKKWINQKLSDPDHDLTEEEIATLKILGEFDENQDQ